MKKKLVVGALLVTMLMSLAGCSSNCKEKGCDNEVYKDGYCSYHYGLHYAEQGAKDLINWITNN